MNDFEPVICYARNPPEALQVALDAMTGGERLIAAVKADAALRRTPSASFFKSPEDVEDWRNMLSAPIYFFSGETAGLIQQASVSYPLSDEEARTVEECRAGQTVKPSYWPNVSSAFAVFERPTLFIRTGGRTDALSALVWTCAFSVAHQEFWLSIRGLGWASGIAVPVWWSDGGSVGGPAPSGDEDATFQAERSSIIRWICAASMFIEQEIVKREVCQAPRAFRKRAERLGREDSTCHVVTLRREHTSEQGASSEHSDVEWSHRWVVRGHWRRQWFPARSAHAPVWIHPHIKGPADKPLREPKPTVYSVTR